MTTKIVYIDDDIIVAYKESGIPTVPLKNKSGESLLSLIAEDYPEVLLCHGRNEWEGGILHRLDTPTRGLVIAARNQASYDFLFSEQDAGRIIKRYRSTVTRRERELEGFPSNPYPDPMKGKVEVVSRFRSFGAKGSSVRPVTDNKRFQDGPEYSTIVEKETDKSFICTIRKGFRHQIRCHLSWCGYPIAGDIQYGAGESEVFGLEAISLDFIHPRTKKKIAVSI